MHISHALPCPHPKASRPVEAAPHERGFFGVLIEDCALGVALVTARADRRDGRVDNGWLVSEERDDRWPVSKE